MIRSSVKPVTALLAVLLLTACQQDASREQPDAEQTEAPVDEHGLTQDEIDWIATQEARPEHYQPGGNYYEQQIAQHGPPPWERNDLGAGLDRYEFTMLGNNGEMISQAVVWIEPEQTAGAEFGWYTLSRPHDLRDDELSAAIRSSIMDEHDRNSMHWPPNGYGVCTISRSQSPNLLVIDLTPPTGFDHDWMVVIPPGDGYREPKWTYWSSIGRTLEGLVTVTSRPD